MLRIILVLISFLKIITCEKPSFELFKKIMPTTHFKKYFPYKIQFYSDGNIAMSVPRMYYGDVNIDNDLKAYPTLFNITKNKEEPDVLLKNDKIYSVMGFVIDMDDSLYILDQGIINSTTNTTKKDSAKLIMYNEKNKKKITYNFNNIDLTYSLLTDVAVDHDGKYAYITDSGNQNVGDNSPGIIVVNLKSNQTYKILNNHESFKHNENEKKALYVNTNDLDDKIYKYFHEAIGVNSIHISCNDDTIYYTSYKKKNIFIVSTDEIQKAIENYEKSKNKDDLNNIKVNSININFASENTIISSKNNIFSLNLEQKYIEESFNINEDLSVYEKDNKIIMYNDSEIGIPVSISIYDGNLYLLDPFCKSSVYHAYIYKAELPKDELNNNFGCTVFHFKLNGAIIFIFVWFFIILVVAIIIIIANSGNTLEKSNLKKEMEKEADINELNKELNE